VAKRYAVALFNTAVKMDIAEQVDGDVASFNALLESSEDFRNYMHAPQVLTEDKKDLIVKAIADRSSGLFLNFVMLLIDKKRLEHFDEIADGYRYLFEQLEGIVEVKAVTAVPLERDLETKTIEKLESQTGKRIRLVKVVDEEIIGGMILVVEDKIIDGSIRHQLGTIKRDLCELKVH
jgi:F-type H+-transporting ATPase subunit delta